MMDNYGNVLNYNDFSLKYGFVSHSKEFYNIVDIPKYHYMVLLVKGFLSHYSVTFSLPSPCLGELCIRDNKCNNKYIRSVFIDKLNLNRIKPYVFK